MPGSRPILAMLLFLIAGCSGPVSYTRLTETAYPPVPREGVEVFLGKQPARRYIRIALISTHLRQGDLAANLDLMKREAAELGADGIILISARKSTLGSIRISDSEISSQIASFGADTGYSYSGYAIRYLGPPPNGTRP